MGLIQISGVVDWVSGESVCTSGLLLAASPGSKLGIFGVRK